MEKTEKQDNNLKNYFSCSETKRTKLDRTQSIPFHVLTGHDAEVLKKFTIKTLLKDHVNAHFGKYADVEKEGFVNMLQKFVDIGHTHGRVKVYDYLPNRWKLTRENENQYDVDFETKKKVVVQAAKQKELQTEADLWENTSSKEKFAGVNACHWTGSWEDKIWVLTNTALAMEPMNPILVYNSNDASVRKHTAQNLDNMFERIYETWGIQELIKLYRFFCTTDGGADIVAAMKIRHRQMLGVCHLYQTTMKHAWKKAKSSCEPIENAEKAADACVRKYQKGSLGERMRNDGCPSLEKQGKTRWDGRTRKFEKMHVNERYLRSDIDAKAILENIPENLFSEIAKELTFHLANRKKFERQKPTMHLLLLTIHTIEERIKSVECSDVQLAIREAVKTVLHLKRGPGTGRITCLGSILTDEHCLATWLNPRFKKSAKKIMTDLQFESMKTLALNEIRDILQMIAPGVDEPQQVAVAQRQTTADMFEFDSDSEDEDEAPESLDQKAEATFQKWDQAKFKRKLYGKVKLEEWGEDCTEFFQNNKRKWPVISRLYRRKAPIRSSEAAVERFFSGAKFVVESKSHNITGKNLKVIVMQNIWSKQMKNAKDDFDASSWEFRKVSMAMEDQ